MLADRRYALARDYAADGDLVAAADLYAQATELAPGFASAWFALGEAREALGDRDGARAAFEEARRKGVYHALMVGDIAQFLSQQHTADSSADLVIAADVFAYIGDVGAVCDAVARVLAPNGLFGFTVETHAGEGAIVGTKMR